MSKRLKEIKSRQIAFKHWHTVNRKNQISDYSETHGPDIEWLINRVERLTEALEFYADMDNHEILHKDLGLGPDPHVYRDHGKIARKALENE